MQAAMTFSAIAKELHCQKYEVIRIYQSAVEKLVRRFPETLEMLREQADREQLRSEYRPYSNGMEG